MQFRKLDGGDIERTGAFRSGPVAIVIVGAAICLGFTATGYSPAIPMAHANDNLPNQAPFIQKAAQREKHLSVEANCRRPMGRINRATSTASDAQNKRSKLSALRLLRRYIPARHTGVECTIDETHLIIEDPWSGEIERVHFADAIIRVDHPRFGRADPASGGLKAPLVVTARNSHNAEYPPRQCVIYSSLLVPERVTQRTWAVIDQLLAALTELGAKIEQSRPPDDPITMGGEAR